MKRAEATSEEPKVEEPHEKHGHKPTWTEQIELHGEELVASAKRLAAEGRVKRIRITEPDGDFVLEMPLTIGAIVGGAVVLAAPLVAVLSALAAVVSKVKVEIIRNGDRPDEPTA